MHFFNIVKLITMFVVICYFWIWTSDNRIVGMDVLEQLVYRDELNLKFHENRMISTQDITAKELVDHKIKSLAIREADNTVFHNFADGAIGNMPKIKYNPKCKYN